MKKLTCDDTNPLYKGFNLHKFSFNIQFVKWVEETGKIVMYNDPFVAKHKNKYKLLRNIHYQEKNRNIP